MMRIVMIAAAATVFALLESDAEGCAAIGRSDRPEDYIRIAEESAIIIWDPVKKVEHFVRRAAFDTKSPDFGFLVPTPTKPILVEVDDIAFTAVNRWILPKVVEKPRLSFDAMCCFVGCGAMQKAAMSTDVAKDSVRVLGQQKVGGFDAAIFEADSTEDLAKWLKDHGYSNDPALQSWLFPYVTNKWKVTAFKISHDPETGNLATTKPVRMSFAAERPFFPYREPESKDDKKPQGGRLLRVYFISDVRVEGKLGDANWHAKIPWSDALTDAQRKQLVADTGVPGADLPAKGWMTTFEDVASPRPGKEEVYFDPAKDQTPILPPPIIHYNDIWIPIDVVLGLAILALLVVAMIIRTRRHPTA